MKSPEHSMQKALFDWAAYQAGNEPALEMMFGIPNAGKRSPRLGRWMKEEGLKRGVPDAFLAVPAGRYSGLFLELKVGNNTLSKDQTDWIVKLRKRGYACGVCWSLDECIKTIQQYLAMREVL